MQQRDERQPDLVMAYMVIAYTLMTYIIVAYIVMAVQQRDERQSDLERKDAGTKAHDPTHQTSNSRGHEAVQIEMGYKGILEP